MTSTEELVAEAHRQLAANKDVALLVEGVATAVRCEAISMVSLQGDLLQFSDSQNHYCLRGAAVLGVKASI